MGGVISAAGLGKQYRRYHSNRPFTLQEAILRGLRGLRPVEHFWALREISFEIEAGKIVGVLGPNGAGKSTLLRLIGGVGKPDEGSLQVSGRTGALIDLGAGFHADLTGRDNVFINGIISGLTRREVEQRFDSIVEFAELGDFIDSPLRTYSTGMQMRLGFAIAVHTDPEILLIDEVLAVGDIAFQQKCMERIAQFKTVGCTILLVSHDPGLISRLCDEAMWLQSGRMAAYGPAHFVADQYLGELKNETERRTPEEWPVLKTSNGAELRVNENRIGSMEMEIVDVCLTSLDGGPVTEIESGAPLRVEIDYVCPQPIESPIFAVRITSEEDAILYDTSTEASGFPLPTLQGKGSLALEFERLDLSRNRYYVDVAVYKQDWLYAYDYHWHAYPVTLHAEEEPTGPLQPPHHWTRE
jgi:lipopolysaccharide transport system ATP-binding protein